MLLTMGGCASFQAAGQVQSGRQALVMKDPESALAYLKPVADQRPDYIYTSMNFSESLWAYVGRAQYALGRYDDARHSFEQALSVYPDGAMAQMYLGLTLLRTGDRTRGLKQTEMGLKSLYKWIDFLNSSRPYFAFWDPNAEIRKEIDKVLAMIPDERTEPKEIFESVEWIGQRMEEEIDKVRADERRQFQRELDRDGRRGVGVGVGIGF
jgi:tetratricopeptide (TPR) repeat protein